MLNDALGVALLLCVFLFFSERLIFLSGVLGGVLLRIFSSLFSSLLSSLSAKFLRRRIDIGIDKTSPPPLPPLPPSAPRPAASTSVDSSESTSLGFFASFRAVLLLGSVLLTPLAIASVASLFSVASPMRVLSVLLWLFPLALFFQLLEGWAVFGSRASGHFGLAHLASARSASGKSDTSLAVFFRRFDASLWRGKLYRFAVILFASGFLLSLLFELLPSVAEIFFQQSARLFVAAQNELTPPATFSGEGWGGLRADLFVNLFFGLELRQAVLLITLFLLAVLGFPLIFARPLRVITFLLCILLPVALLFYGTLCFLMLEQSAGYSSQMGFERIDSSFLSSVSGLWSFLTSFPPSSDVREFSGGIFTSFLLIFRSAFGFFALAYLVNLTGLTATGTTTPATNPATTPATAPATKPSSELFSARARFLTSVVTFLDRLPLFKRFLSSSFLCGGFLYRGFFGRIFSNMRFFKKDFFVKVFSFFLLLALCFTLLFFIILTMLPILSTGSWRVGELGFAPLYGAFISLYPGESLLLSLSLLLLSLTSLLGISAFGLLALRLLSSGFERYAIFLFLPLGVWGAFRHPLRLSFSPQLEERGFFGNLDLLLQSLGLLGLSISALVFMLGLSIILFLRLASRLRALALSRVAFGKYFDKNVADKHVAGKHIARGF